jgi:transcriptional regulator with XRE-family HTH domain
LSRLAASAGLSVSYLNDIEHDRTVPTLKTLGSIADALGLSVRDFLKDVYPYDGD